MFFQKFKRMKLLQPKLFLVMKQLPISPSMFLFLLLLLIILLFLFLLLLLLLLLILFLLLILLLFLPLLQYLIGWQLSIWICCKPFFSLLYNYQLLYFWQLALIIVVEVFLGTFFQIFLLQGCSLPTGYA